MIAMINPISTVPTWMTLTHSYDDIHLKETLRKTMVNAICLLVAFVLLGKVILVFFGLSIPAIKLAGALMIVLAALKLEVSKPIRGSKLAKKAEENHREDISFSPVAMPLIIGPGTIAMIITYLEEYGSIFETIWTTLYLILSGIIILGLTWILLAQSKRIMNYLGYGGITAMSRISGFILLCIGAQFLISAIKDLLG